MPLPTAEELEEAVSLLAAGEYPEIARSLGRRPSRRDFQRQFRVRRFAGPSAHAETLDGLRIVHLTDMHVGRVTPVEAQPREISSIASA